MDPICTNGGCYMFSPGSPERTACEQNCRLNKGSKLSSILASHVRSTKLSFCELTRQTLQPASEESSDGEMQ